MNNINPFDLLGVTTETNLKDVRRAYYKLSLICHPDKGGAKEDMIMLHNAYNYVKRQIEFSEEVDTLENIEEDFKNFFENNKIEIPPFYQLWERSEEAEFLREFNKNFEEKQNNDLSNNNFSSVFFNTGYGKYMERSEIQEQIEKGEFDDISVLNETEKPLKEKFKEELVIYEEPNNLPNDYGEYERLDVSELKDFSQKTNKLNMFDYKKAHSNIVEQEVNEEKIKCNVDDAYEKIVKERNSKNFFY